MNFFTSDLHFGHKNIVAYTNRGKVIPEGVSLTQWLVDIWKRQVRPTDTVYHLGDFAFLHQKKAIQLLTELPGNKVLIHGNHDSDKFCKAVKDVPNVSSYFYKEIKIQEIPTILFHFPISIWHKQHHGSYHLFGHSHGNFVPEQGFLLDVGIDSAYNIYGEHRFFTEADILAYMSKRTKTPPRDHHRD